MSESNGQHREPDQLVARIVLALIALLALAALVGVLCGAPAPLPRREQPPEPSPLPRRGVMTWNGVRYQVEFRPGGGYRAGYDGRWVWHGVWRLDGWVLTIREWMTDPSGEITYRISMRPCLRRGSIGGGAYLDFGLEP